MKYEYDIQVGEDDYDTYEYDVDRSDEKDALIHLILKRYFGDNLNKKELEPAIECATKAIKELLDFIGDFTTPEEEKYWDDFIECNNYDDELLNYFERDAREQFAYEESVKDEY